MLALPLMAQITHPIQQHNNIRELCRKLKPLGAWDTVEAHGSVKQLPVLNIDLLAHSHTHPVRHEEALKTMVVRACLRACVRASPLRWVGECLNCARKSKMTDPWFPSSLPRTH